MLRQLSQREQETLARLGEKGPGGNFDTIALNKLFTLGLIAVDEERRVVPTDFGRSLIREINERSRDN